MDNASASRSEEPRRRTRGRPTIRKLARFMSGLSLQSVSSNTGISMRRLSDFENERCDLSESEAEKVRVLLLKEVEKDEGISLLEGVRRLEMAQSKQADLSK